MIAQGKSHRYVSSRTGSRRGQPTTKQQAQYILESMAMHPERSLDHYEPMSDELRGMVEAELAERGEAPTHQQPQPRSGISANPNIHRVSPVDNDLLSDIVVHIVRATMRKGNNPKVALMAYNDPQYNKVRKLVAEKLTHSECIACGIISENAVDSVEQYLRYSAKKVENERYAAISC